jgi:hypothetical protein
LSKTLNKGGKDKKRYIARKKQIGDIGKQESQH